jgi:acetyl esterase/lipase
MGHSSGAHLSLLLATNPKYLACHQLSPDDIAGVIGLSSPTDLEPRKDKKGFGDALLAGKGADVFSRDVSVMKEASPIQYVSKNLPPTLLIVGERDFPMLEGDAKVFARKAKDAGVNAVASVARGCDHMAVLRSLLEDHSPTSDQVLAFLKKSTAENQ